MGGSRASHSTGVPKLATASYDSVVIWDLTTGKEAAAVSVGTGLVHSVAFSPDGKALAAALEGPQTGPLRRNTETSIAVGGEIGMWNIDGKRIAESVESEESALAVFSTRRPDLGGGGSRWCASVGPRGKGAADHYHDACVLSVLFT